jgi:hypothetical protein
MLASCSTGLSHRVRSSAGPMQDRENPGSCPYPCGNAAPVSLTVNPGYR